MHILIAKGTVTATTGMFMHTSWAHLKAALVASNPAQVIEEQWDMCDAWTRLRDGHLICDGPSIWQYVNATDPGDDNWDMEHLELFQGKEIYFLPDMEMVGDIVQVSIELETTGGKVHMDKFQAKQAERNKFYESYIAALKKGQA